MQDLVFSNRPATNAIKYLTYDRADMAFAHYGPFWRQMRKLCVMKLFSRKRAESWTSVRHEVDNLITTIANNTQTPFNLGHLVFSMTMNIIYRAAFGTSQPRDQAQFIKILEEFSKLFGAFNVADFFPCLGWIDPQGITSRLVEARRSLDRFIDRIIDQHLVERKERDQEIDKDMVDELLAFYSEDEGGNNETDLEDLHLQTTIKLTRDNIKAIIMVCSYLLTTINLITLFLVRQLTDFPLGLSLEAYFSLFHHHHAFYFTHVFEIKMHFFFLFLYLKEKKKKYFDAFYSIYLYLFLFVL